MQDVGCLVRSLLHHLTGPIHPHPSCTASWLSPRPHQLHRPVSQLRGALLILCTVCRSPEECSAADNAVAALGKVLEFRRDCVTDPALGQAWLDALPLQEDAAEAALAHAQLVRWVQANDPW